MKLSTLFMLMVALQFTLLMFGGNSYSGLDTSTNSTALFTFVTHPFDWSGLSFFQWLGILSVGVIGGLAIVGTLVFGKNDLAVFAAAVGSFISFCIPISSLWIVISEEVGYFGVQAAPIVASVICAPLMIYSIITIVNWWRSASDIN